MTQYAALIYTRDADWTSASEAETSKAYDEFGNNNGASLRGGAALHQTSTATTVCLQGGKDGGIVTTDGPFAEAHEIGPRRRSPRRSATRPQRANRRQQICGCCSAG